MGTILVLFTDGLEFTGISNRSSIAPTPSLGGWMSLTNTAPACDGNESHR